MTLERLDLIEAALSGARPQRDGSTTAVADEETKVEVKAEAEQPGTDAAADDGGADEDAMVIG